MAAAFFGTLFLVFFVLSPLRWVELGVPWVTLVITFFVIPLIDLAVGRATPGKERPVPAFARWIPRLQLPLQAVLLFEALRIAQGLSALDLVLFALAVGAVTGGLGITIAHELGHRPSLFDRLIARALLVSVGYSHFFVEHVRGHHIRVATPEDPASAPRGMDVYRFMLRSVVGSFAHAWQLETQRLAHRDHGSWSLQNWVVTGTALTLLSLVAIGIVWGPRAVLLFVLQAVVAIALLETINYIEHYGLVRRRIGERYEPVHEHHSWDADWVVSNWILFNLQLHSDHHSHMQRPYETLRAAPSAPQLPAGYPAMLLVAWVPPLWFAMMNPRLPSTT